MSEKSDKGWFYAKRYGFGSGPPRTWQGWLVLAVYLAVIIGAGLVLMPERETVFIAIVIGATIPLLWITWAKTPGGWKWRWGKDKETW